KQGLRLCLEPARLVELRLDAFPPVVDTLEQELVRPEITEHADEDDKGDRDPELGFEHRLPQRLRAWLMAWATSSLPGDIPDKRSTIAPAASLAMLRTLPIAADRFSAMVFSASAIWAWSFASTSLRRASAAAAAFARVSFASTCARPRASANAFSWAAMAASEASLKRCASARSSSIRRRRASRVEPTRGKATRDIHRESAMKGSASQNSCEAKVCESNGGNPRPCSLAGISTVPAGCALSWAMAVPISFGGWLPPPHSMLGSAEGKQQKQRDQQREDAERLGDG